MSTMNRFVAELFGDLKNVCGEEYGTAVFAYFVHESLEQVRSARVKTDKRFVHDNELRFMYEGGNYCELLLHAVGIC